MVIAHDGEYAGLLSGGCLEGDLAQHARQVLEGAAAHVVSYDMRGPDDLLFGLGSGCEGAMDVLLQRVGAVNAWQPLERLGAAWQARRAESLALVVHSQRASLPGGTAVFADGTAYAPGGPLASTPAIAQLASAAHVQQAQGISAFVPHALDDVDALLVVQAPPPRLLVLGGGPDALPLAQLAHFVGWRFTLFDHRHAYAQARRFPEADAVILARPEELGRHLGDAPFAAAIVMSHHLNSDLEYLRALADTDIGYIGLLGPPMRREKLLASLGAAGERLRPRLHAPVGLAIGADSPETIALAIVAEIQGQL
jgi:xanthine/CO dehydrogenase XdhC/CoxF family maturation factor